MKYKTVQEAKRSMQKSGDLWRLPFMEFVDDLRRTRDHRLIQNPLPINGGRFDILLASTIEYLCDEMGIETPDWVWDIPSCKEPWFVSGYENLKAISIAESPAFLEEEKYLYWRIFFRGHRRAAPFSNHFA